MEWEPPGLIRIGAGTDAEKHCESGGTALGTCTGGGARFYDTCNPGPDIAWESCHSGPSLEGT